MLQTRTMLSLKMQRIPLLDEGTLVENEQRIHQLLD